MELNNTPLDDIQLTSEQKSSLIASYPLFSLLDEKSIQELASLTKEIRFDAGSIIVKEGDVMNSVFLLFREVPKSRKGLLPLKKLKSFLLQY